MGESFFTGEEYHGFPECIAAGGTYGGEKHSNQILTKTEEVDMAFQIPKFPPTTAKSIRFPNDVLEGVNQAICGRDCTFSAFVVAAVRAALDELKEEEQACLPKD